LETLFIALFCVFASFAIIQFLYLFFVFLRIVFYKKNVLNTTTETGKTPTFLPVSVIVAAHNELKNLQKLLPILLAQNHPDFEIIVAEDRSYDESFEYLYELRAQNPLLRIVRVDETPTHITHKKFALTLAIKAAKNEILLFTDADCMPQSNEWITEMSRQFLVAKSDNKTKEKAIILGISPYFDIEFQQKKFSFLNFIIQYETFYTVLQYMCFALAGAPYMGVGRNLSYKKSLFMNANGFNEFQKLLSGDDDLFVNQQATSKNVGICISKESHIKTYPKKTWKDWYHQKVRHLTTGKYYKLKSKVLLGFYNISTVGFWISQIIILPLIVGYLINNNLATIDVKIQLIILLFGIISLLVMIIKPLFFVLSAKKNEFESKLFGSTIF
jgi:cellulose synthase/poly-beta-1,6-N-acetylglucosamine synthase-like glycosyltransferase